MRHIVTLLLGSLLLLPLAACGDKPEDLMQTARFEEQQFNQEHAIKLYQRIVREFPDSSYAQQARQRLQELSKGESR
ncbi:MAG: hypothetical protein C0616_05485 [Desulfuromonas sp.]|mgnify:FL=1|nr:MAG: hypothetical protein C0616_05485 [Desulfuromonas sp.]